MGDGSLLVTQREQFGMLQTLEEPTPGPLSSLSSALEAPSNPTLGTQPTPRGWSSKVTRVAILKSMITLLSTSSGGSSKLRPQYLEGHQT